MTEKEKNCNKCKGARIVVSSCFLGERPHIAIRPCECGVLTLMQIRDLIFLDFGVKTEDIK